VRVRGREGRRREGREEEREEEEEREGRKRGKRRGEEREGIHTPNTAVSISLIINMFSTKVMNLEAI
jgi:hypothetical protein